MIECTGCKKWLPESKFGVRSWINIDGSKTSTRRSKCRSCTNQDNLIRYYQKSSTKEAHRRASYKYRLKLYGLTIEKYEEMIQQQDGNCAICNRRPGTSLHVDHCHKTGKIRELLCNSCNTAMGSLRENPEIIRSMLKYIAKHEE